MSITTIFFHYLIPRWREDEHQDEQVDRIIKRNYPHAKRICLSFINTGGQYGHFELTYEIPDDPLTPKFNNTVYHIENLFSLHQQFSYKIL